MTIHISDAKGRVKEFRNGLHKFGAMHPFTFGTITFLIGALGVVGFFNFIRPG